MALATMIQRLVEAREAYDAQLAALGSENTQKGIAEMFGALLPEGLAIQWEGDTPYFSDGDPCKFSCGDPTVFKVQASEEEDEYGDDYVERVCDIEVDSISFYSIYRYGQPNTITYPTRADGITPPPYVQEAKPLIDGLPRDTLLKIKELWDSLPVDLIERVFGDPARVTIFSGGRCVVNEYEHD